MATCSKCKTVLVRCSSCGGSGRKDASGAKCVRCNGTGQVCQVHGANHS
jgi:RecJ-like exonuclease